MHSVDHVDVGVPGRAEHHSRAFGEPARGVCREVVRTEVGLRLDDAPHALDARNDVHEVLAEELPRDEDRVAVVESARKAPRARG